MQNGSLIRAERRKGPAVWEFRWRELGGIGKRRHRRIVLGSVDRLVDQAAARQAVSALRVDINPGDTRVKAHVTTVSELAEHYRQRELRPDTVWKTYSTKVTYEGYLNKWILPRWGNYPVVRVNAGEVELWLRSLTLARASCAKIRNLMSVLFNHGMRYEICERNPIQLVRQSAKRRSVPVVLTPMEVQRLLSALAFRERTLVLLAFGTGLRMSELFGLKWRDINFQINEVSIVRSIVFQVVSSCKTEASQKPIPLDPQLADALLLWCQQTRYKGPEDWVFAIPATYGNSPYWGQCIMRTFIRPAALRVGIVKPIGWHTFRHTYSPLLRQNRTDIKVTQELLRHASSRVTLDTYTQAVTLHKRKAQSDVIRLLRLSSAVVD
jgi:integrase